MQATTYLKSLLVAAVLSGLLFTKGKTDAVTGMLLYDACQSKRAEDKTVCEVYIAGFQAGIYLSRQFRQETTKEVCIPVGSSGNQVILVVEKFMKEHPEMLHLPIETLVFRAIFNAFPCSQ